MTGGNGDRLEFSYLAGVRSGPARYAFADGSVEVSTGPEGTSSTVSIAQQTQKYFWGECKRQHIMKF